MRTRQPQSIVLAVFLCASHVAAVYPETSDKNAPSSSRPLQATLIGSLDAAHLKEGSDFRLRVAADWEGEHCRLRTGEIVRGHVSSLVKPTKLEKSSSFQVSFFVPTCSEVQVKPMAMSLIAVVGPPAGANEAEENRLSQGSALADGPSVGTVKEYPMGRPEESTTFGQTPSYSRNARKPAPGSPPRSVGPPPPSGPQSITVGQVLNVPRIALQVGAGGDAGTVIAAASGDARIESGSMLVLVAADQIRAPSDLGSGTTGVAKNDVHSRDGDAPKFASTAVPSARAREESAVENEVCSTGCVTLNALEARRTENAKSAASVPLSGLGYSPHQRGWARSFNHETTVTFLDEHRLLCTFDPHQLRSRDGDSPDPWRDIKAVLIDPTTFQVQRVMQWRVRGDDTYLWRFGDGKVLVRMGNSLRLMDRNLSTVKTIPVQGTVAWVVSSPSNDHTAVGVVASRAEAFSVEEQAAKKTANIAVEVFDANLNLVSESKRAPDLYPPVLSDGGELRLEPAGAGKWDLIEYSWQRKARALASLHSACRPLFSAQENGLTFVTGCAGLNGNVWYRMLDAKGHTLLKSESFSDEIAHRAEATSSGSFAIRVVRASRHIPTSEPFRRSDLLQERIDVFRNTDGKRIGSVTTDDFVIAENSFALSPGGDQMAVVGKEAILFYKIGKEHD